MEIVIENLFISRAEQFISCTDFLHILGLGCWCSSSDIFFAYMTVHLLLWQCFSVSPFLGRAIPWRQCWLNPHHEGGNTLLMTWSQEDWGGPWGEETQRQVVAIGCPQCALCAQNVTNFTITLLQNIRVRSTPKMYQLYNYFISKYLGVLCNQNVPNFTIILLQRKMCALRPKCTKNNTITDGGVAPQCTFARPT